jgi:hypothetical protein
MAKAKTTDEIVREYFQDGIKYYEDDDKLIVILPVGLKKKKADLFEDDLVLKLVMEELNDIEIICQFKAPKATKEVLVLLAEDAKGFDS